MVKATTVSVNELCRVLDYDADAGFFTWKVSLSSRSQAGQQAGTWLKLRNGRNYLSITYQGRKMSAAQVAWALYHKEWPDRSVFYIDEDSKNLKISNLRLADHKAIRIKKEDGSIGYKMSKDQQRHYGLMRYYGISIGDYAEMYRKQDGKCAICHQPEIAMDYRGAKKDLAVDHCHDTGAVRELLCYACNSMLGQAKDKIEVLLAGVEYLKKHKADKNSIDKNTGG